MQTIQRVLAGACCGVAVLSMAAVAQMAPTTAPTMGATSQPTNLLKDAKFDDVGGTWQVQSQEGAEMTAGKMPGATTKPTLEIDVTKSSDTDWHAQVSQADLKIVKGHTYTLSFTGKSSVPTTLTAFLQIVPDPYTMLSERQEISLTTEPKEQKVEFTATDDSTEGKLCLAVATKVAKIQLSDITLTESK